MRSYIRKVDDSYGPAIASIFDSSREKVHQGDQYDGPVVVNLDGDSTYQWIRLGNSSLNRIVATLDEVDISFYRMNVRLGQYSTQGPIIAKVSRESRQVFGSDGRIIYMVDEEATPLEKAGLTVAAMYLDGLILL